MKYLLDSSIAVAAVLVMAIAYSSNYSSYYNCMSQTKSETITQKGADHVAAQCKVFILERIMVK